MFRSFNKDNCEQEESPTFHQQRDRQWLLAALTAEQREQGSKAKMCKIR